MMDLTKLSTSYQVRRLNLQDADHVLKLVLSNDSYYNFCPPRPNRHTILEDIKVVPANKTMDDKYYVGFYDQDKLIAVLDLISGYPDEKTAWIGFFMGCTINRVDRHFAINSIFVYHLLIKLF